MDCRKRNVTPYQPSMSGYLSSSDQNSSFIFDFCCFLWLWSCYRVRLKHLFGIQLPPHTKSLAGRQIFMKKLRRPVDIDYIYQVSFTIYVCWLDQSNQYTGCDVTIALLWHYVPIIWGECNQFNVSPSMKCEDSALKWYSFQFDPAWITVGWAVFTGCGSWWEILSMH